MMNIMNLRTLFLLGLVGTLSCTPNPGDFTLPTIEPDMRVPDLGPTSDLGNDANGGDAATTPGTRVDIDLEPYLDAPGPTPTVRAYELEGDAPFSGAVTTGRPGDWVIENEVARFLIEGDKRVMSPCPWGGTPIDAAYLADGTDEDILGEVCMLVNGGLSFRPDTFEIIHDGSDGGAVTLAASGKLVTNDFLNLPAMIDDFVQGLGGRIQLDVDAELPLRVTTYYVLNPGETHLRVLTAFRNDGDERADILPIFLVASGGDGYYFNPLSSTNGFGSGSSSLGVGIDNLAFMAFNGERTSYAFAPQPDPDIPFQTMPIAGAYIIISGVAASILGAPAARILDVLTASPQELSDMEEVMHIEPGAVELTDQRLMVGTAALSSMVDDIYDTMEIDQGLLRGTAVDTNGAAVSGARVTALLRGFRTMNQTISADDGTFEMRVPAGEYEVIARRGGMAPDGAATANLEAGGEVDVGDVRINLPARLRVAVTTPDDGCSTTTGPQPVPARLTIICDGDCPNQPSMTEADVAFHGKPSNFAAVIYGGPDGILEAEVPPGDYRVVVSRGIEWSMWPADATDTGGIEVSLGPDETVELDAEIARVVDTQNAYSGDFHIHSITSPDSTVPFNDRVLNFVAEGVDLMVSTDHDYISDYRPTITELDADPWIQAISGNEVTTADLGHFNAFPLEQDLSHSRGGALDWGGGDSYTLTPEQLYAAFQEAPGEQVIQVNHAAGLGLIKLAQADVLRGVSYADREKHRLPPFEGDPKVPGDTGIWSDDFTAMELMNGNARTRFYRLGRWWMTMIGRGFAPTGTAVTDTHKLYADLGGVPRTYVFLSAEHGCGDRRYADLADYDAFVADYVQQTNLGNALGTNGPFFGVTLENAAQEQAGLGETIASQGDTVTAKIALQMPEWMTVDSIDVYLNPDSDDVITRPGQVIEDPIPPTANVPVTWDPLTHVEVVKTGGVEHRVRKQTVEIPLDTAEDAFVIFVVKGDTSMWPLVGTRPFAFSNPVFIDADGNGYDNPPYAALASRPPEPGELPPCVDQFCGEREPQGENNLTPEEIIDAIRHLDCQHPLHQH